MASRAPYLKELENQSRNITEKLNLDDQPTFKNQLLVFEVIETLTPNGTSLAGLS